MCPSREWMTYSRRFAKMPSIRPSEGTSAIVPNTTLAIVSAVRRRFRPTLRKAIRKYMANCRMDMFFSLALRHDAVGDRDCTFRVAHHLRIVRRDEERGMFGVVQPVHQRQDRVAGLRVEVRRRLVGEYQRRGVGESARDRDPLPLSAPPLRHPLVPMASYPHPPHH